MSETDPRRWRVVLVRPPPDGIDDAIALSGSALLPTELLVTHDADQAHALLARLEAAGAIAVLLEAESDDVICKLHPPQLLGRTCRDCGDPVCAVCRLDAGGMRLCAGCVVKERKRQRERRTWNGFLLFLFTAFCYFAIHYWRTEQSRLDPNRTSDVAVFQFAPPELIEDVAIRRLNDPNSAWGLARIADWYSSEYRRYTGQEHAAIRIQAYGPWTTSPHPPKLESEEAPAWRIAWSAYRYPQYFHSLARDFGQEPDDHDARIYVIYTNQGSDPGSHSRGSSKGRVAISFVSTTDPNPAYAQITVAHELGHILGAEDLYDADQFKPIFPEGYVEPHREPLFPQRFAEVMAVDRPLSVEKEAEATSLEQVRIGYHTAGLMRWISEDQAAILYRTPR